MEPDRVGQYVPKKYANNRIQSSGRENVEK